MTTVPAHEPADAAALSLTQEEVLSWMLEHLAAYMDEGQPPIDVDASFERLGLDSMEAVALTGELEREFGVRIDPTALWDLSSLRALAGHAAALVHANEEALPASEEALDALLATLLRDEQARGAEEPA